MGFSIQDLRELSPAMAEVLLSDLAEERRKRAQSLRQKITKAKPMAVIDLANLMKD